MGRNLEKFLLKLITTCSAIISLHVANEASVTVIPSEVEGSVVNHRL